MADDTTAEFDFAPYPEPFPEMSGIDRIDIDNVKAWMVTKDEWEAVHGRPRGASQHHSC